MAEMRNPLDVVPLEDQATADLSLPSPPSPPSQPSQPPERPPAFPLTLDSFEMFHCGQCRKTFSCRTSARSHRKANACRNSQETTCSANHKHKPISLKFDSMAEAEQWRLGNELDRYFSFKSGQKFYRVLHCSQNVKDKMAGSKKSKKIFNCDAKIFYSQRELCLCDNHESEWCWNLKQQVLVYGCLEHSHPIERNKIRLSKIVKDRAAELIASGVPSDVVLKEYLAQHEQDPNSKPLAYSDVYQIKKRCKLKGYDGKGVKHEKSSDLPCGSAFKGPFFEKRPNQIPKLDKIEGRIWNNEQEEIETFLAKFEKVEESMRLMKNIVKANDKPIANKRLLMESLRLSFDNLISASLSLSDQ
ncbi:hypothetical protein TCAL_06191 [Tigriopus californicus]|uniref:C2H2-type domain-containing protein n=1 Tax=Tigriopus californicus TaxID=6832 RepID=A0A553NTA3_TIGCA|nr:uncharacterized protein LOC131888854 [Tigriopus californicus]TRY68665.1 hypothetical protein TCAL_06191 [Tigriopus californicus]